MWDVGYSVEYLYPDKYDNNQENSVYKRIMNWLKWKLAGEELKEFYAMKKRSEDVEVWCSGTKLVSVTAKYINPPESYPYQAFGYQWQYYKLSCRWYLWCYEYSIIILRLK